MKHSPPVLCSFPNGDGHVHIVNCGNYRSDGSRMSCALGYTASISGCASCKFRTPLVSLAMPEPIPQPRMRGLGDLIHHIVRILFLGRLDIAERLAGRVEALWRRPREDVSIRLPTTPRHPCGCKARQQRLNALLPFGK